MTNAEKKRFGENLDKELKYINMSQTELALRLGTTRQVVNKWVKGKVFPRLENIAGINTVTGISTKKLLEGVLV